LFANARQPMPGQVGCRAADVEIELNGFGH
jgi:hypothetical protein